jgi:hypothetical protein
MQYGGVRISGSPKDAFDHFLQNATLSYMSSGSYGTTIIAELNSPSVDSPYTSTRIGSFNAPVRRILIKFISLEPTSYRKNGVIVRDTRAETHENFANEVNIQTDIYLKTMSYLQPLCPAIMYSMIYEPSDAAMDPPEEGVPLSPASQLWDLMPKDLGAIHKNLGMYRVANATSDIGIIAMELADGYATVYKIIENWSVAGRKDELNVYFYESMGMMAQIIHTYIELAVQTGYAHGDHHLNNIMFKYHGSNYYAGVLGEWMLIDFGMTQKIHPDMLAAIREHYAQGRYEEILKLLYSINRPDGVVFNDHLGHYGYLIFKYNPVLHTRLGVKFKDKNTITSIRDNIADLIDARNEMIEKLTNEMAELHDAEPNLYPLLPVSNAMKNTMYSGFFMEGGRQQRRRHPKTKTKRKTRRVKKTNTKGRTRLQSLQSLQSKTAKQH